MSVQERFELYWSKRWEWELKRGFASHYSLRQVNGEYIMPKTLFAYGIWCDAMADKEGQ